MKDYILLMHADTAGRPSDADWPTYFAHLRDSGAFQGGSAIGDGAVVRKHGMPAELTAQLDGYIRVRAIDLAAAQALVIGNPVYEAGGSVEIRELPAG